jgi:pimeloyl-ACP methyl ester carboxylesterase
VRERLARSLERYAVATAAPATDRGFRSTRRLADALGGWLCATGTTPAVLLGNSYGCQVIVDLVIRHPEVAAAVVLSGPTTDPRARTVTRQVLRWLRDAVHEDPLQAAILLRDVRDAGARRVFATLRHAVGDRIDEKLPSVSVPALVIRGGIEPIVPTLWADEAARFIFSGSRGLPRVGPRSRSTQPRKALSSWNSTTPARYRGRRLAPDIRPSPD